jgi:hypothetical protein
MNSIVRNTVIALISCATIAQVQASWLSDFTGVNIDPAAGKFTVGPPNPGPAIQRLPQVIQNLPQDVANLGNPAGLGLALAIRHAKEQASYGAQPIPAGILQQLQAYFPADVLQSVRYNTFDGARIGLDNAVMMLNNDVVAITLEDIIVFRNGSEAQNVATWAHELTHVLQYRSRGIDTFANTYTSNAWVLENEARDNASRIMASLNAQSQGTQQQQQAYFNVTGQLLYADPQGNLYPADQTGRVIAPANGRVFVQNGQYWATDSTGRTFPAVRVQ